jgi:glutathione-independent formaldehyde dehydrogenase
VSLFLKIPAPRTSSPKKGQIEFDFGLFWLKASGWPLVKRVKAYNRQLRDLIHTGRATPSSIISHKLPLASAPDAYEHIEARDVGWTKVVLKPAA